MLCTPQPLILVADPVKARTGNGGSQGFPSMAPRMASSAADTNSPLPGDRRRLGEHAEDHVEDKKLAAKVSLGQARMIRYRLVR
jgi:hypothetical protein